jgi:hypothetical protein
MIFAGHAIELAVDAAEFRVGRFGDRVVRADRPEPRLVYRFPALLTLDNHAHYLRYELSKVLEFEAKRSSAGTTRAPGLTLLRLI